MLDVKVQGQANLAKTAQDLLQARGRVRDLLSRVSQDFANAATTRIKEGYLSGGGDNLKVRTGRLRSSIRYLLAEQTDQITVTFGSDVPYAAIHEFGGVTSPHTIVPKRREFLRFVAGGKVVFVRKVNHPGSNIRKRPFLEPGVSDTTPALESAVQKVLVGAVEGAWHGQ